jgi:hypothetical protein
MTIHLGSVEFPRRRIRHVPNVQVLKRCRHQGDANEQDVTGTHERSGIVVFCWYDSQRHKTWQVDGRHTKHHGISHDLSNKCQVSQQGRIVDDVVELGS